jgi:hypothetical protein
MPHHDDPPATALAHGSVKTSDVEQCRQDIDHAVQVVAEADKDSAIRRVDEAGKRTSKRTRRSAQAAETARRAGACSGPGVIAREARES